MNDQQLERNLQSIGKICFVTYFKEFSDFYRSREEVAAQIANESRGPTGKRLSYDAALTRRVYPARNIIKAGRASDALLLVSKSKSPQVPNHIKEKAAEMARSLKSEELL